MADSFRGAVHRLDQARVLDHVLVLGERHLRRILTRYVGYYQRARTHLALDKDAPDVRPVQFPAVGKIVQVPEVGGLHHRYLRRAAESSTRGWPQHHRAPSFLYLPPAVLCLTENRVLRRPARGTTS